MAIANHLSITYLQWQEPWHEVQLLRHPWELQDELLQG